MGHFRARTRPCVVRSQRGDLTCRAGYGHRPARARRLRAEQKLARGFWETSATMPDETDTTQSFGPHPPAGPPVPPPAGPPPPGPPPALLARDPSPVPRLRAP